MNIVNARLRGRSGLFRIELAQARIAAIVAQAQELAATAGELDAAGNLVVPPFVEPHIHLDATALRSLDVEFLRLLLLQPFFRTHRLVPTDCL